MKVLGNSSNHLRETVAEVNCIALAHNLKFYRQRTETRLMAVIKADAYGHDALMCARVCMANGADCLAVATPDEAIVLREGGISADILVLGPVLGKDAMEAMVKENVSFTVYSMEQLLDAEAAGKRLEKQARIHIKVETGFNRIGIEKDEIIPFLEQLKTCENVALEGLYTHFATADDPEDDSFVHVQYRRFSEVEEIVRSYGHSPMVHVCNSAAILRYPEYHRDAVRLGISLYGYPSSADLDLGYDLWPVMSVKSVVSRVRDVLPGEVIGYNCTYHVDAPMKVAAVPIGYADGYPRALSNSGAVLIGGKRCPIVGRVCMDQLMVDVSGIDVKQGDPVVLMGKQGQEAIWADEIAALVGTIPHEIITGFTARLVKVHVFDFQR